MFFTIKKVINNNVLCVADAQNRELIVTGKGIGFGHHAGEALPDTAVEKTYRMESSAVQRKLLDLSEQIPYEHLALTDALVGYIRTQLHYPLNESLLITLADHISFAVERARQNIRFTNPLMDSIRAYYPEEYRLGVYCLGQISTRLGVSLADDEAGFIALHIVNAELNTSMPVVNEITKFVEGCVQVVEYYYHTHYDRESLDFNRFSLHLRFFGQRLFQDKMEQDADNEHDRLFRQLIARNCARHYQCATCVAEYVQKTWHKTLSDEEMVFLTLHLKRINPGE
ncbi:MAG: PRD domain-containing protein [Pygmaiobacter sp.]|nr:PRD domain-containing protein [Pygmaiobacter sp.]